MEKQPKPKINILKFLPKAASVVSFQNLPFSPNREKRSEYLHKIKTHAGRGFSGPIISLIPHEARSKPKAGSFETQDEPTSPKVSCMGQIKAHKKKLKKNKWVSPPEGDNTKLVKWSPRHVNKHASVLRRIFSNVKPERKSDASADDDHKPSTLPDRAASLSQMKRFASGRGSFSNFDWTAQIVSADKDRRNYHSDEDRDDSDHEDDVLIPFSAPMLVGGGVPLQPRKEVNLWKRRTMTPPRPLQLHI